MKPTKTTLNTPASLSIVFPTIKCQHHTEKRIQMHKLSLHIHTMGWVTLSVYQSFRSAN